MTHRKAVFLFISSSAMMLSVFYTCTAFILAALSLKPVPVSGSAAILLTAALITFFHHQRGWRRIYIAAFHLLGFLFASLKLWHGYYVIHASFWRFGWITGFRMEDPLLDGFTLFLLFLFVMILWFGGIRLVTRPSGPKTMGPRFDLGLAFLFLLLLIKLIMAVKGALLPVEHSSVKPVFAFLIFGLFSLGFVRMPVQTQAGGIAYLSGAGTVLSFTAAAVVLGGGLLMLFLPELQSVAATGADLLKTATRPLGPVLVSLLRFALVNGCRGDIRIAPYQERPPKTAPLVDTSGDAEGIGHLFFVGFTAAGLLVMTGLLLYLYFRWLFSRSEKRKKGWRGFFLWITDAAKRLFSVFRAKKVEFSGSTGEAQRYYQRLLRWGRFSGVPPTIAETPREYGCRLGNRFPQIEKEIRLLVCVHDEVIYGGRSLDADQLFRARGAFRRMCHPVFWGPRIKTLLLPMQSTLGPGAASGTVVDALK